MGLFKRFLILIKKKKKIAALFIALVATSLVIELQNFNLSFPIFSFGFLILGILLSFQYFLFLELSGMLYYRFNLLKDAEQQQERINRNLMLAIEEIIDLQKQKS